MCRNLLHIFPLFFVENHISFDIKRHTSVQNYTLGEKNKSFIKDEVEEEVRHFVFFEIIYLDINGTYCSRNETDLRYFPNLG